MKNSEYQKNEALFCKLFEKFALKLSNEGRENVEHYINHAELEMACESLVLSLIEEKIEKADAKEELLNLCIKMQLDRESIFRDDFWKIAYPFLTSNS